MRRFWWGLMLFFAVAVALYTFFVVASTDLIKANSVLAHDLEHRAWALYGHLIFGAVAMLVGPFQFLARIRQQLPGLHRWMGRTYVSACVVSALCALVLAVNINMGAVAGLGFGSLALVWLLTTIPAYLKARARDFEAHRRWMVRSYAATYAAVSLRIFLPLMLMGGVEFPVAYAIIAWACWLPNLACAELYLRLCEPQGQTVAT